MVTSKGIVRFDKGELWQLFVAAGFPIHVWAIILLMNDISWVATRTNYLDAIGVAGYGIVFSLIESILVWSILVIAGLVLLRKWTRIKRVSLLSSLALAIFIGAIIGQILLLVELPFIPLIGIFLVSRQNPILLINGLLVLIIGSTVFLLSYFAVYSEKFQSGIITVIDLLSPLMGFYVFLDLLGVISILIRNY